MRIVAKPFIILSWLYLSSAYAGISGFVDVKQLREMLSKDQPCCVIDARDEGIRKQQPIPFAITYRDGIKSKAGGYALVVGKTDEQALKIAQKISGNSEGDVYAVAGGYASWQRAQSADDSAAGDSIIVPHIFTIPKNTCEQGKALHEYK